MPDVLIDRLMPLFDVSERHRARVMAPPDVTYGAAMKLDLARSRLVRSLLAARGVPGLLRGRPSTARTWTLDDFFDAGFVWLGEDPGVEFVVGAVGAFWRPTGRLVRVEPAEFGHFDDPGYAKAALNLRVAPVRGSGRSVVSTETRIRVPDEASRRKFLLYWAAIGPFSGLIRTRALALVKREAERA